MSGIDQRQRTVLEFARGIGLGVNVGDLLELERPLHRDRMHRAAPQEQRVLLVGETQRQAMHGRIELQRLLDQRRQLDQARDQAALALGIGAVVARQRDGQHRQRRRAAW